MKSKYIKPSELLKLQKETGKSYWDLIGRPLGKKPKDPAKDVVDEYDPVQREALRMQIESALDYPQYKSGKSPKIKTWNDNDVADLIIGFEGFLPHAKDIGDGKITIGSGLTNPKYTRFGTITPEQNRRFVLEEIAARKTRLSRNVPGWNTLPGSAKAALLSYDYGWMVDRKTSPKMMKALQDKNWPEVANQMNAGWNMKKFKKGLRKRRTQERNLFLSDLYRPAPLKPVQTVSPMPEAKVPFEVNQMEDKVAPIINQQQPIVPYTSTVELPQEYTIPENDMASIDLENTSRIKPNDILQSYYNMFGYKRGKSFPFQFWNRANNTMRLQRFEEGKNNTNLVKIVGNEQAPYEQPVRFDENGNLITRDLTRNLHSNSILLPEVTVKGKAGYNLANHVDVLTPWGLTNALFGEMLQPVAQSAPNIMNALSYLRYAAPSYYIDRLSGTSDEDIMNGGGKIFGTGNSFLLDALAGSKISSVRNAYRASINKLAENNAISRNLKPVQNWARNKIIGQELDQLSKEWDGTVTGSYFNSPYNWYRISQYPEKLGIEESGKNITTRDLDVSQQANRFRESINKGGFISKDGSWYKQKKKKGSFLLTKQGSAHGNTSQAAKGQPWSGTTARSRSFRDGIIEGQGGSPTYRGFNLETGMDSRTSFHLQDWDDIPIGSRIGFHTGEMPINNLTWFEQIPGSYKYKFEPILPEKRINIDTQPIVLEYGDSYNKGKNSGIHIKNK